MAVTKPKKVYGRLLEVDLPIPTERDWIFEALQDPGVYLMLGCKSPPDRRQFDDASHADHHR